MDKDFIIDLLTDEEMINIISKERVCVSVDISIFNFFNVFFNALSVLDIKGYVEIIMIPNTQSFLKLQDMNNEKNTLLVYFCERKLQDELDTYNIEKCDMSFRESAEALVDIFINLLG